MKQFNRIVWFFLSFAITTIGVYHIMHTTNRWFL